jgi:Domain of unknown function (DUF4440)
MSMDENRRREYKRQAGVTDAQLDQAIGAAKVSKTSADASGLAAADIGTAEQEVRQLIEDVTVISARYSELSKSSKKDAREVAAAAELNRDRALLQQLIGDDYRLATPFGTTQSKQEVIEAILSGTIRPQTWGRGGFESTEHELQVHGKGKPHAVVSTGTLSMKGSGLVEHESGARRWRDLSGTYQTTHTYSLRDDHWELTASHMTKAPPKVGFTFVGEKGVG